MYQYHSFSPPFLLEGGGGGATFSLNFERLGGLQEFYHGYLLVFAYMFLVRKKTLRAQFQMLILAWFSQTTN